jgi:hypothetical protein
VWRRRRRREKKGGGRNIGKNINITDINELNGYIKANFI